MKTRLFVVLAKLLNSPIPSFNYFRGRLQPAQLRLLNRALSIRGRCTSVQWNVKFLKECLQCSVAPRFVTHRIKRARLTDSIRIERVFLKDELSKCETSLRSKKNDFQRVYAECKSAIPYPDFLQFFEPFPNFGE